MTEEIGKNEPANLEFKADDDGIRMNVYIPKKPAIAILGVITTGCFVGFVKKVFRSGK